MKKYILTIMIWSLLVILTELPLTYFCPNIQTIDIMIIDIYIMLSIVCRAGAKGIMDVFAKLTKKEGKIGKAFDIASECINYRIGKRIKPRKCMCCEKDDCRNCNDNFNRCPSCNEVLDDDCSSEPRYCPDCGQALIWHTEDGFSLRN